ncbi:unnamed protein product [Diamesa serratosioi]
MIRVLLVIVALCAVAQAQVENEWTKVESPLDSPKYRDILSKMFPDAISTNKYLRGSRITGGQAAVLGQFPYQALLLLKDSSGNSYVCGGSIISHNWILTAAHCVDGIVSADIYVGIVNRSPMSYVWTIKVNQNSLMGHENYDASTISNDIALVRLASAIPQHASVNYISLPRRAEVNENLTGKAGIISGFGRDSDNSSIKGTLRWVEVTIIQNEVCEKSYENVISSNVCVETNGGKSACSGDSGGPLTVLRLDGRSELAGIVSYGKTVGCEKGYPSVFTRVHSFLDWIGNKTGIQIL